MKLKARAIKWLLLGLLCLGADPARPAAGPDTEARAGTGDPGRGAYLFEAHCMACHGREGHGDGPIADSLARDFQVRPADLGATELQKSRSDRQLIAAIRGGGNAVHKSPYMPPSDKTLTAPEIDDLVAYIREIEPAKAKPRPEPKPSSFGAIATNLVLGRFLYSTRCLACHGQDGRGNGPFLTDLESAGVTVHRPPDFSDYTYIHGRSDQSLEATIDKGLDHTGWRPDKETRWLERPLEHAEMRALIFHLRAFSL